MLDAMNIKKKVYVSNKSSVKRDVKIDKNFLSSELIESS